jgi:hypothetical protein
MVHEARALRRPAHARMDQLPPAVDTTLQPSSASRHPAAGSGSRRPIMSVRIGWRSFMQDTNRRTRAT